MSKKQDFIKYVESLMENQGNPEMPEDVELYWTAFKGNDNDEKPMFTDNGKIILKFLQDNPTTPLWKSKDIAEGLFISSRAVSGAIRKLVTDGFVEKVGQDPVVYAITEKGKNITID